MKRLLLISILLVSVFAFAKVCMVNAAQIPFDGMYIKYAGSGTVTMNNKTGQVQLTGSVVVSKATGGYSIILSFSIMGLPQPPYLAARSIAFIEAENTRVLSQSTENYLPPEMYNPIWIPVPAPVGSSVQIGSTTSPFELKIVGIEPFEALGKKVKCVVAQGSHSLTMPDYSYVIDGVAYYEEKTGLLMGGTLNAEFSANTWNGRLNIRVQAQVSAVETNASIGGWPWYLLLVPIAIFVLAAFVLYRSRVKEKRVEKKLSRMEPTVSKMEEESEMPEELITCSFCGAKMPPNFTRCAICGTELHGGVGSESV
jgi:hypothetical protein